ncbi:L-threonylcarbamoyladenylate synthase [Mesorhizobium sp. SB112]|uniref:L-threonylcarbamoyladenylate synthase n=1 Tax=Mesorhizobium sp. SB112 TaxID=3151853 RepID=UPI003265AFBE
MAKILEPGQAMDEALTLLGSGDVIAVPTETVYGLAGDATNGEAVARIFEVKGRPRFNPMIAHVSDMAMAERLVHFDEVSRALAEAFWPGALTLVLRLKDDATVHPLTTAGLHTLAVRMPRGFSSELIAALGRPLAAPSANSSGLITGTSAAAVEADLGPKIKLIVDGGATPIGVESTIVKVDGGQIYLLRPGGVAAEDIEKVTGLPLLRETGGKIEAPGMLASHYAPRAAVRLGAVEVSANEALLGFGPTRALGAEKAAAFLNLSERADLREAAANLFSYMRELDASGASGIAVEPVPTQGLGEAINDRLSRAAAPRHL